MFLSRVCLGIILQRVIRVCLSAAGQTMLLVTTIFRVSIIGQYLPIADWVRHRRKSRRPMQSLDKDGPLSLLEGVIMPERDGSFAWSEFVRECEFLGSCPGGHTKPLRRPHTKSLVPSFYYRLPSQPV